MRTFDYYKYKDWKWDSEILKKVSSIYHNKGKLEVLQSQNPLIFEKLTENSKFESIVASNLIEGIVTTNYRFKQLINKKSAPKNRSEQEIAGYKDVLDIINESYNYIDINSNYILQLHKIMYQNILNNSFGGKYKNVQNYISVSDVNGNMYNIFTPLTPYETPQAIKDICTEYNKAIKDKNINPLIISFIFILDFLSIHPFNDGNGRISRLLTNLVLLRLDYFISKYVSIENIINNSKEDYYDALYTSQKGWLDNKNDPTPFINYMLSVIELAYEKIADKVNLSTQKLSAYELVKYSLSNKIGKITKAEVIDLCPTISTSSIEKSIAQLVKEGILEKKGSGKNTFYIIKMDK